MNANDVIESYVIDVATRLPRRQRNDVAFELRALLQEELHANAEGAGREPDAAMATALVNAFGAPADVAARYRPTLTIIDPADGHAFLRYSVIGLLVIWGAGLFSHLRQSSASGLDLLTVFGQWWGDTVIPSLWWPGVLVVGFGGSAWARRRWPQSAAWKPRAADRVQGGRASVALGLVGVLAGAYLLVNPHWILDFFWDGKAAPAAYRALTYTDAFLRLQGPVLLALILVNVPLFLAVIVRGRHSPMQRRFETGLSLVLCAVMVWTIAGGPILMSPAGDRMAKTLMALIVAFVLLGYGIKLYRSVRPGPLTLHSSAPR